MTSNGGPYSNLRPAASAENGAAGTTPVKTERFFSHRPAAFASVWWWLVAGVVRDWRGTIAALFAAWFGLPTAILLAIGAAVALGVSGYIGGGSSLSDMAADVPVFGEVASNVALRIGGGLGALLGIAIGILVGSALGLLLPWASLYGNDPIVAVLVVLLQLVCAGLTGMLYVVYAVALEPLRLRIGGARRLSRREEELLLPLLHECAYALGFANVPRLLVDDTREANAFAYSRHIVVSRGLLEEFSYDGAVLAGVLSHELTHWYNADGVARLFVRGVALPLYLPYTAASWVLRTFQNGIVRFLAGVVALPISAAVRFVIMPMQASDSRRAEYRADQGAVLAGHRDGLRKALERFRRSFDSARNGWDAAVCATHPFNELRLEQIEQPGKQYPLPVAQRKPRPPAADPLTPVAGSADGGASS